MPLKDGLMLGRLGADMLERLKLGALLLGR
jgi:hypothetical protein